jgi:hypothetical protein
MARQKEAQALAVKPLLCVVEGEKRAGVLVPLRSPRFL